MNVVIIGPMALTGILYKAETTPQRNIEMRAKKMPLSLLNKREFFKSLKSTEIKTMPRNIIAIEIMRMGDNFSPKNKTENKTVMSMEELAIGEITPIFPRFIALKKSKSGIYPKKAMPREMSAYLKEKTAPLKFNKKTGSKIATIKTPLQKVTLTLPSVREGFCDIPLLKPKPNMAMTPNNTPNTVVFIKL